MTIGKPAKGSYQGKIIGRTAIALITGAAIFTFAGFLASCGSSQADKSAPALDASQTSPRDTEQTHLRGQFVDSPVSGLFYRTDTREGFTDHNGYFEFAEGEIVSFYIGNIALGGARGSSILTPLDLSEGQDLSDTAVNILRLLQTLDYDGDPGNGISITTNTHLAASQIADHLIDVTSGSEAFAGNPALLAFISQVTNLSGLIPAENAIQHFQQSSRQWQLADSF
ncbi:MAG: hypothetical protein R3208_21930 [Ketobacteraceae bacterium]|nr:hypothetical protein [Ketobacteraceae bacterium]